MASDYIPQELYLHILRRLPVKTLCRFQSVCKSWRSLISSSYFSKTHQTFNSTRNTTDIEPKSYLRQRFHYIIRCQEDNTLWLVPELESPIEKRLPNHRVSLSDVIHGVVFFTYSLQKDCKFAQLILFWNPSIRRHVSAHLPQDHLNRAHHLLGGGYDALTNDFKAVWVPYFDKDSDEASCYYEVFSARAGVWKQKKWTLPGDQLRRAAEVYNDGCFFNGAIYWMIETDVVVGGRQVQALVYFNCESEEFGRMELPDQLSVSAPLEVFLDGDGLLCLMVMDTVLCQWTLWTMKENGMWTKELTERHRMNSYFFQEGTLLLDIGKPDDQLRAIGVFQSIEFFNSSKIY